MKIFTVLVSCAFLAACGGSHPAAAERHYALTGKIVSLDPQHQTATVDAAAIPNFMDAMTMEYPVKSKDEFKALQVGEQISATIDVNSDDRYALSNIKAKAPGK